MPLNTGTKGYLQPNTEVLHFEILNWVLFFTSFSLMYSSPILGMRVGPPSSHEMKFCGRACNVYQQHIYAAFVLDFKVMK